MAKLKLKKILLQERIREVIDSFVKNMSIPLYIEDDKGTPLIDKGGKMQPGRYAVKMAGSIVGWVRGDERCQPIAALLSAAAVLEHEKKILAREALDKYREINLLYNISEKISACLDLEEISGMVIEEVQRLMTPGQVMTVSGALMLLNDNSGRIELLKGFGKSSFPAISFAPGEGIIGDIVSKGKGEIVNDVLSDPRCIKDEKNISSMICAPLKTKNRTIGCICLYSREPVSYSAEEQKRLTMLASYTASAIENAQLYNTLERKVQERTRQLAEKNKQIMDSIVYAEGIQQAILPLNKEINAAFPGHFIFYRPKDIISGDLYWFHQSGDKIFLAAIDCTGHGVPGALLAMIGNSLLDELVKERQVSEPALILRRLHQEICRTLKLGEETGSFDGMDIALCVFDKDKKKLTYAGARRPLYVVRFNGAGGGLQKRESEFIVIDGDRKTIGGRQREKERVFSSREIEISPGDMIYLTTDGLADQNNPAGERYGSRRFKAFLYMAARHPVLDQARYLEEEFLDFKGDEAQRDDITVIGVQI